MVDSVKLFFSKRSNVIATVIAFIGSFLLFPTRLFIDVNPVDANGYFWNSIDPSWEIAINYINNKNLVWGKDFVFTYGPLAYLSTRIAWGVNKYMFLLFDLFYFANWALIFYLSFKKSQNKYFASLFILMVIVLVPTYFLGASAIVLFMFLIFWIRMGLDNQKTVYYVLQVILMTLLFFIKFNTGLISFFLFYLSLSYLGIFKKEKALKLLGVAVSPILIIILLSFVLNVSLFSYLVSGFELIAGYNEIMYFEGDQTLIVFQTLSQVFIAIALIFMVLNYFAYKKEFFKRSLILVLFSIGIFVLYKQSFVRADTTHVFDFFKYTILLVSCVFDFSNEKITNYKNIFVMGLIGVILYANNKSQPLSTTFSEGFTKKIGKALYFKQFFKFTPISGMYVFPNNNSLPEAIKTKIGNNTVDVYPWNVHLLIENNLNYQPRPVIQSYSAYTKYLENLNFDFYNSEKAPQFVLYDNGSIDDRYPFFDEPKVNLALLKNYTVVDTFFHNERDMLLLEKKPNPKPVRLEYKKEYTMGIDQTLLAEPNIYYEVEVSNSMKGKLYSILKYSPELALIITSNTQTRKHRTSKSLLKTGLFASKFVYTVSDFKNIINSENNETTDIFKSFYFLPKDNNMFIEKIKITEYKITQ